MRATRIVASGIALLVVVVLLGGELVATSLATGAAHDAVEGHADVEQLEVTSLARPASLGLLRGEARDVRITARGVQAGDLRIDRADAWIPVAPVGFGTRPETLTVAGNARLLEEDLQHLLRARAPELGLELELELHVSRELELLALDLQNGAVVVSARAELPAGEGRAWR